MQLLFCCLCLRLLWWFWNWWSLGPKHFEFVIRFCVYKHRAWLVPDKLSKNNFDHTHRKPSRCWNTWTWTHCAFFLLLPAFFVSCMYFWLWYSCWFKTNFLGNETDMKQHMFLHENHFSLLLGMRKRFEQNMFQRWTDHVSFWHRRISPNMIAFLVRVHGEHFQKCPSAKVTAHFQKCICFAVLHFFVVVFHIFNFTQATWNVEGVVTLAMHEFFQALNVMNGMVENILAITKLTYLVLNGCYTHAQSMHIGKNMFDCNIGIKCLLLNFQVYKLTWQLNKKQYEHVYSDPCTIKRRFDEKCIIGYLLMPVNSQQFDSPTHWPRFPKIQYLCIIQIQIVNGFFLLTDCINSCGTMFDQI